jgi:MFS family permease
LLAKHLGLPRIKGSEVFLIALLVDALGTGLFLPFSLLYFQASAGLPLVTIGLALSLATVFALPFGPITGTLVDRFGARRLVIVSQLFQGCGFLGYLIVNNTITLICFALLTVVGQRIFWSAFFTLINDIATPEDRDRWYGLSGAAQNAGIGLGGLLGGLLVTVVGLTGYRLIVIADALSFFVSAALLLLYVRDTHHLHVGREGVSGYAALLRDRPFLILIMTNIVFALINILLSVGIPVYLATTLKMPAWVIGSVFTLNTVLLATLQTMVVRHLEPHRRTRALILAGCLWSGWCGLVALAFIVPHMLLVPYLIAIFCIFTLAELIHAPTSNALAASASPPAVRGRYLAVFQSSWGIATVLAPGLFTVLFTVHPILPWLVVAVLMLLSCLILYRLEPHLPPDAVRSGQ